MTSNDETGGIISNYLGPWYGLAFHSMLGIWGYPNATDYIDNEDRLTFGAPTPGVMYTTGLNVYGPPSYFEAVSGLMKVIPRPCSSKLPCV